MAILRKKGTLGSQWQSLIKSPLSPPEVKFSGVCLYGKEVVEIEFPFFTVSLVGVLRDAVLS